MKKVILQFTIIFSIVTVQAQNSPTLLPDKQGTWKYDYNIQVKSTDDIQFKKNVSGLIEWFHQQIPL